jgi:LacI family transcriptional regulator
VDALAAAGVAQEPALVRRVEIDVEAATAAAAAWLDLPEPPTAIFAVTDAMAIGVLRAARARGVGVPRPLAVVGMDDIEMSAYTDPPLTTVRIPKEQMGQLAAERLIGLIGGERPATTIESVPGELVMRASCGGRAAGSPKREGP